MFAHQNNVHAHLWHFVLSLLPLFLLHLQLQDASTVVKLKLMPSTRPSVSTLPAIRSASRQYHVTALSGLALSIPSGLCLDFLQQQPCTHGGCPMLPHYRGPDPSFLAPSSSSEPEAASSGSSGSSSLSLLFAICFASPGAGSSWRGPAPVCGGLNTSR